MFKDAFIKLDAVQAEKMTDVINPFLDSPMDPKSSSVLIHDLSFYKDYFLAEISNHNQHPPMMRAAICNGNGDVHVLSWANDVIFKLNKTIPVHLNDNSIIDYIRFFFSYVKGKHGRFIIVESVDDIDWREEPAPAGRKALAKMIEPITLKSRQDDGTHVFKVCIVFKNSLFQAEAHVKKDGLIFMTEEELLVEDIPVADDLFGL
jgi:hypothetical protein